MILFLASFSFKSERVRKVPAALKVVEPTMVLYPQYKINAEPKEVNPPFLGSTFHGFKEALAFSESRGNYFIINTLGYIGKYQFGIGTLQLMGVYNATQFLNDPGLQEKVFNTNIARNKWILRKDILLFSGKKIRGIKITESGILAAAHLAGPGNVRKYLRSFGRYNVQDAYGTAISDYIARFSGYDVSNVSAKRNPRV
ncbi:MAG: hypothetical protein ACR2MM_07390 [Flavobacteriaceae bacterium]